MPGLDGYFGIGPSQSNFSTGGTDESFIFNLRKIGLINHEIVMIHDNKMRIGNWDPRVVDAPHTLNVV